MRITLSDPSCWFTFPACKLSGSQNVVIADSERTRIGLATFDHQLQFWSFRADQQGSSQQVVGDVEEPFCPAPASSLPPLDPALRSLVGASLANPPPPLSLHRTCFLFVPAQLDPEKGGYLQSLLVEEPFTPGFALICDPTSLLSVAL